MNCLVCDKPATWTRATQFAGNHPFCEEHAREEVDFQDNDSYIYWTKEKGNESKDSITQDV
jgi:endogenous inhibitor of DNA gyrase (YacG/DUF329 family)